MLNCHKRELHASARGAVTPFFVAASRWGYGFFCRRAARRARQASQWGQAAVFQEQNGGFHEVSRKTGFQSPQPSPTHPERIPAATNIPQNRTKNAAKATAANTKPVNQTIAGFQEQNGDFHESRRKTGFKRPQPSPTQPERIQAAPADHRSPTTMPLQAEIQKRQQSVSDLKRQVEQITALAGEDKKAGIRVADALRKRKLRASMKDVKIRDPADVQRRLANSADIYSFLSCYFPDVFCTPKSATRSWPWTEPPSGEPPRRPTASGRS